MLYVPGRRTKTLAISPGGNQYFIYVATDSVEEATRRGLELCGAVAGVPCMIVALDDTFVVPVPATMRVTGFFKASDSPLIAPEAREDACADLPTRRVDGARSPQARQDGRDLD